jgi:O-acetylhomoserine (thiol)-lyase
VLRAGYRSDPTTTAVAVPIYQTTSYREAARRFIDALEMFYHVANIGDARSLAIHPAATTHWQPSPDEQLQTGVDENYVRLSIGIEHEEDIISDLAPAFDAA